MDQSSAGRAKTVEEFGALLGRIFAPAEKETSLSSWRPRPTDVVISPYSKCGTTWLQQIFHTLRTRGDMDFDDINRVVPWLEMATLLGIDPNAEQKANPRGYKSHLAFDALPSGAKAICALRDPKDAVVSMYHFMDGWFIEPGAVSLEEFARAWIQRVERRVDIWNHLLSWWAERDSPSVLLLTYEGMSADPEQAIRRMAAFVDIPLDDELLAVTLQRSSIAFMAAHKTKYSEPILQRAAALRCGLPVGGHAAKVRNGGSGSGTKELPKSVATELDAMWAQLVAPVTGCPDYQSLALQLR